jgi:NAD(P)-dependent dehydrogenase (short-subunit alcohol dehydrogenase family)
LIDKAVAAAGRVDILVNNAMKSGDPSSVETMPYDMYARTIEFCLTIPFLLCQAVIPVMKRQGGGWILNVGSVSSYPPVRPYHEGEINSGMMVYAAGKAAITRLTQGLAAELQADNIAVNMIAPSGAIRTPGASPYIPDSLVCEPIEYIASVALDMVHSPAAERTGLVAYSMHFAHHYDLAVTTLDGRTRLPRAEWPQHGHPDVNAVGF